MLKKRPDNFLKSSVFRLDELAYEDILMQPSKANSFENLNAHQYSYNNNKGSLKFRELTPKEKESFSVESATAIGQLVVQVKSEQARKSEEEFGLKPNVYAMIEDKIYLLEKDFTHA